MKIIDTQKELEALIVDGNIIIGDHLTINCSISLPEVNIKARDIKALDIKAGDIVAENIVAWNIVAENISYYAIAIADESFVCKSIKGRRENSIHKCLDKEIKIWN